MQEQAFNSETPVTLEDLTASLAEVFKVEEEVPADMLALLNQINDFEFCREVALDQADQRLCRLLSNTANRTAQ